MLIEDRLGFFHDPDGSRAGQWAYVLIFPMLFTAAISISFFAAFSSAFMVMAFLSVLRSRDVSILRDVFFKLLAVYLVMNALSLTQTQYWSESWRGLFKVFRHVVLCWAVVVVVDTPKKIRKIFMFLLIVAAVVSADGWYQWVTGHDLFNARKMTAYYGNIGRWTGPFKHANDFSAFLAFAAILYLGVLVDGFKTLTKKKYFFILGGLALVLSALFATYSRTGWFVFLIVAVKLAVLKRNRVLILAAIILVIWSVFFSPASVKLRLSSIWDPHGGTMSERSLLWREAESMIRDSPVLGLGINTYSRNESARQWAGAKVDHQYAHNGYLQMAAEIGLLGLFSFLSVMLYLLFVCFKAFLTDKQSPSDLVAIGLSLTFGVVVFLIHGAFDTGLQSLLLVNLLWISAGLAVAVRRALCP